MADSSSDDDGRWTHEEGPQAEWLGQTVEDVLEPELPIIDPHHHLFLIGKPNKVRNSKRERSAIEI